MSAHSATKEDDDFWNKGYIVTDSNILFEGLENAFVVKRVNGDEKPKYLIGIKDKNGIVVVKDPIEPPHKKPLSLAVFCF